MRITLSVVRGLATVCMAGVVATSAMSGATPRFYYDDPIAREPESQDASKAEPRDIPILFDFVSNLFGRPGDPAGNVRARNINTIDEVPDSSWFTNRILARQVSIEEVARGPLSGTGPAPGTWTIVAPKRAGAAPGFVMRDAKNEMWFVSFDALGYPEAATGAILVANKIFWTLGYWQVENYLATIRPGDIQIAESASVTPASGVRRPMRRSDLDAILRRAHRSADGTYRAVAARALSGRPLEGFLYHGTRSDDPNDVVPHEHRRELRALKVFGAWTNLVDMKAGNTLDALVTEGGRGIVRHYLQDVGSTFGSGANGPRESFEGWEYMHDNGLTAKRFATLGFAMAPWMTVDYADDSRIGRFEGDVFDPVSWKPRAPNAAFLHARPDDNFWAARRVVAFSDEMIRAVAATGQFSNPASVQLLGDILIKRRDAIARAYLPSVNPVVEPSLSSTGQLVFTNAAVDAGVAKAPAGYNAVWSTFDNATGESRRIGESARGATQQQAPAALPDAAGAFVKIELSATSDAHPAWQDPIHLYFQRLKGLWRLVGLERLPEKSQSRP
jgi:hypothetical protein